MTDMSVTSQITRESILLARSVGCDHWRLWEWLNGKIDRLISNRKPFQPTSLKDLWSATLDGRLNEGDYVQFNSLKELNTYWHLQEWVPKAPGQSWVEDSFIELDPAMIRAGLTSPYTMKGKHRSLFHFYSSAAHWEQQFHSSQIAPEPLETQGFNYRPGCYRPSLSNDRNRYAMMGICTAQESIADLAFPVIVSREVYLKYVRTRASDRHSVEFEGVAQIGSVQPSDSFSAYLKAVGAPQDEALKAIVGQPLGVPTRMAEIVSPLDVTFRVNDSHPLVTVRVDGFNSDPRSRERGILMVSRASVIDPAWALWQKMSHSPQDLDRLIYSVDFLIGPDMQFDTNLVPVTDFDGRLRRFACHAWIGCNPAENQSVVSGLVDLASGKPANKKVSGFAGSE